MELHTLEPAVGSKKKRKRIGRGQGSGKGGTATKGHKGAQSRSGYKTRPYFEGGQTPLQRRIPKVGFKNPTRKEVKGINLSRLEAFATKVNISEITTDVLVAHKMIRAGEAYKILAKGKITKKINVIAPAFSHAAQQAIEACGGTIANVAS